MNVSMAGILLDGTKVGNKRMSLLQAHFHLEVWNQTLQRSIGPDSENKETRGR